MTPDLDRLLGELEPPSDANLTKRLAFGLTCCRRIAHLLENPDVRQCLAAFDQLVQDPRQRGDWPALVSRAADLANRHQGSKSLDGVGHAAVSATYACAKAIAGNARQAAEYAAYAMVYAQGGYGATSEPTAFEPEFHWQARQLQVLLDAVRVTDQPDSGGAGGVASTVVAERWSTSIASCCLRPWQPSDVDDLVQHANDRHVWRNLTGAFPHPYTQADAERWIDIARAPGRDLHRAIEVDGHAVGGVGVKAGEDLACQTGQFGYWLGQAHWGKGIATAAAGALLRHLTHHRLFARLEAPVFEWNPASMRVLEKLGFSREAVLRQSVTKDGQLIDSVLYAYLLADAPPRR